MNTPSLRGDLAIAAVVLVAGAWLGAKAVGAFRASGNPQYFYQPEFGPAVMMACGRAFGDPDTHDAPALADFLAQRSNVLDCRAIPSGIAIGPMNVFQRAIPYLQRAIGLTWKITGVSWSGLDLLAGLLFGAVAALTYGLLRFGMSRVVAILALVPSVTSTPNFMQVPHLRDYAKGPFLLATILVMGWIVTGPGAARRAVLLSALGGAIVGLGFGFRSDLVIAMPPFIAAVAFLLPPSISTRARLGAIAVFLGTFLVIALPVIRGMAGGGNNGHVVLLGLGPEFDGPLRIEPGPYQFGGRYLDAYGGTVINNYAVRVGRGAGIDSASVEYERAALGYLGEIAATFPADLIIRIAAAIRTIPKYFLDSSLYAPVQLQSQRIRELYPLRARVLWRGGQLAFIAVAAATVLVSAANPRAAWLIVFILIAFAGASAIQFHERHFFYLQFLPWWAFGFLLQIGIDWRRLTAMATREHVRRALTFVAIVALPSVALIAAARAYQHRSASQLFARYEAARRSVVTTTATEAGGGVIRFVAPAWSERISGSGPPIALRFLAVTLKGEGCNAADLPVTVRYDGSRRDADLSETIHVRPSAQGPTLLFVPTYDWRDDSIRFRGLEVPAAAARCVAEVARVEGLDLTPLLLTTTLRPGWRDERLYQRLD